MSDPTPLNPPSLLESVEARGPLDELRAELLALRQQVDDLQLLVRSQQGVISDLSSPLKRLFLAKRDELQFVEQALNEDGELEDFEGGRECDDSEDESAIIYPPGDVQLLMEVRQPGADGAPGVCRYVRVGAPEVLVMITGNAGGGGKYTGRLVQRYPESVSEGGNLTQADVGTFHDFDDALVLNTREVGQSTHDLEAGYLPLIFPGVLSCTNPDGKRVVVIDGRQSDDCS